MFFAWKGVLLGAHGVSDAATMKLVLRDVTDGVDLITRTYNAAANPWRMATPALRQHLLHYGLAD